MTLLFLPGLLCDAAIFAEQIEALAPFGEIVVADFSQHDSIASMARSALALREGPLVVIGHSMGGRVALEMARQSPERLAALCLMDTGIHSRRDGEEATRQVLVDLAYEQGMGALAERWLPPMVDERRVGDAALMGTLREMVLRADANQHRRQINALLCRPDARAVLPTLQCPTLILVGRHDRWSPLAQHEEMAALAPRAELVVIENSGHMAPLEQPQAVSQALTLWLSQHRLGAADAGRQGRSSQMTSDAPHDTIPETPLLDRKRSLRGYRINKATMGLADPANREAFKLNESGYLDRFGLNPEEKQAVMARDWREMVRLGGNLFFILKISAVDPVRITEIGAHQAGMEHNAFLRERLGKDV